jgi:hypothetical protein
VRDYLYQKEQKHSDPLYFSPGIIKILLRIVKLVWCRCAYDDVGWGLVNYLLTTANPLRRTPTHMMVTTLKIEMISSFYVLVVNIFPSLFSKRASFYVCSSHR